MFFLLIDAHAKWPEIVEISSTTATKIIDVLRHLFAAYRLPEQLVSDNGPQFVSEEFATFMKKVKHIRVAPYHPASNGAVERLVQTFKQTMRAVTDNGLLSQHNLNNFLMTYRTTPHSTTGKTPSQLFLGRHIRNRFSLLMPDAASGVRDRQAEQKNHHDVRARERELPLGSTVTIKDSKNPSQWLPGVVVKQRGPVSNLVKLNTG